MAFISWEHIRERLASWVENRRLNGISTPWLGASWDNPPDEKKIVQEVITYIENQGIFYAAFEWEHPKNTYEEAAKARDRITLHMQSLVREMETFAYLDAIRNALRDFQRQLRRLHLSQIPSKSEMTNEQVAAYDSALIAFRQIAGAQIACLAVKYKIDVFDELDVWLKSPSFIAGKSTV